MGNKIQINVRFENDKMITDSRNVAKVFGKQHCHVLRDIENIKKDVSNFGLMFFEGTMPDNYGREQKVYYMDRNGFSLLAMGFNGKEALQWKLKYIDAFNKLEEFYNSPEKIMARALIIANKQLESKDKEIEKLEHDLKVREPFVEAALAIQKSEGVVDMGTAAKILRKDKQIDIGRNRLYKMLKEHGIIMSNNAPKQKYVDAGCFTMTVKVTETKYGTKKINPVTLVTTKGLIFINAKLRSWLGIPPNQEINDWLRKLDADKDVETLVENVE